MKDIKLWKTNFQSSGPFSPRLLEKAHESEIEFVLEDILVQSPGLITDGLKLLCRKTYAQMDYSETLGVDGNGCLVVLLLKKGTLTSTSISDIINFASYIHKMTAEELSHYIKNNSGISGGRKIDDFLEWYHTIFQTPFLSPQNLKMILIGFDYDEKVKNMTKFLADNGVNISLTLVHFFPDHDEYVIAMQRIESTDEIITGSVKKSRTSEASLIHNQENETTLEDLVKQRK